MCPSTSWARVWFESKIPLRRNAVHIRFEDVRCSPARDWLIGTCRSLLRWNSSTGKLRQGKQRDPVWVEVTSMVTSRPTSNSSCGRPPQVESARRQCTGLPEGRSHRERWTRTVKEAVSSRTLSACVPAISRNKGGRACNDDINGRQYCSGRPG